MILMIGSSSDKKTQSSGGGSSAPVATSTPAPAVTANKSDFNVTVEAICKEYKNNEIAADKKYKGKMIKVVGKVDDVKKDIMDNFYVTLKRSDPYTLETVQCFFDDEHEEKLSNLKKGATVTILGRGDGLMMNVLLQDCELVSK